jgi:hypothetical protein
MQTLDGISRAWMAFANIEIMLQNFNGLCKLQ